MIEEFITYDGMIIAIVSVGMATLSTLVRSATLDKEHFKEQKEKIKEYQSKMKEAQRRKDYKAMEHVQGAMSGIMMEQMRQSFKPMLYTMIPFLIVFSWLQSTYKEAGTVVRLPVMLPWIGDGLGWLGWYIFCSMIVSIVLNKALKLT